MSIRSHVAAWFLLSLVSIGSAGFAAQTASISTELEGTWIGQSAENNGKPLPLSGSSYVANAGTGMKPVAMPDERRITIKGNAAVFKGFVLGANREPLEQSYTCEVDSKAMPKSIILKTESRVMQGLYELTGDTLKLALARTPEQRLTTVSSDANVMYVLKRAK